MIAPTSSGGVFDLARLTARQKELLDKSSQPDFWDKPEQAQALLKEQDDIRGRLADFNRLKTLLEEARVYLTMAEEEGSDDSEAAREAGAALGEASIQMPGKRIRSALQPGCEDGGVSKLPDAETQHCSSAVLEHGLEPHREGSGGDSLALQQEILEDAVPFHIPRSFGKAFRPRGLTTRRRLAIHAINGCR